MMFLSFGLHSPRAGGEGVEERESTIITGTAYARAQVEPDMRSYIP